MFLSFVIVIAGLFRNLPAIIVTPHLMRGLLASSLVSGDTALSAV